MRDDARRKPRSHSFCKAQIRLQKTESEPRWASLSWFDVTPVPPVRISPGRTVIFDIVEYITMEWTMPKESRICRICRRDKSRICRIWRGDYSTESRICRICLVWLFKSKNICGRSCLVRSQVALFVFIQRESGAQRDTKAPKDLNRRVLYTYKKFSRTSGGRCLLEGWTTSCDMLCKGFVEDFTRLTDLCNFII